MENQNIKYKDVPLIKEIEKCNDNILYYGEGGIGKTTQMQLAFNYFSFKCTNTVPVFLDADEEIDFRKADPLMSAIACKYLGSDIETDDIWKLFTNNSPSSAKNYTYIIFVDGINELTQNNKGYLIEKITHIISESKNTRFIISSRIKENLGLRFKNIAIKPLEKKNILKYLGENYGANDNSKNVNDSLVEILQIPLYLSVFKNTYNGSDYKPNIYDESTVRKADILDSYIQKILHEKRETNAADTALFEFIVKYFLPALAFKMVKDNVHVISIMDFRKLRDNTKYFEAFCYDENALDIFEQNSRKAHNYIVENFALLESHNDVYTFPHQILRDYFCAKHIINCLNVTYSEQIQNDLETPVDNEIRGFIGQLIYTYDEKFHYSKEEHFPSKKSDRMCECDFEAKDNLEDWDESPIEHYMQQHNLEQEEQNQISPLVTRNLIEIMKDSRNNRVVGKYSSLNLITSDLRNTIVEYSDFSNAHLCYNTIFETDIFTKYNYLQPIDIGKDGYILIKASKEYSFDGILDHLFHGPFTRHTPSKGYSFDTVYDYILYNYLNNTALILNRSEYGPCELSYSIFSPDANYVLGVHLCFLNIFNIQTQNVISYNLKNNIMNIYCIDTLNTIIVEFDNNKICRFELADGVWKKKCEISKHKKIRYYKVSNSGKYILGVNYNHIILYNYDNDISQYKLIYKGRFYKNYHTEEDWLKNTNYKISSNLNIKSFFDSVPPNLSGEYYERNECTINFSSDEKNIYFKNYNSFEFYKFDIGKFKLSIKKNTYDYKYSLALYASASNDSTVLLRYNHRNENLEMINTDSNKILYSIKFSEISNGHDLNYMQFCIKNNIIVIGGDRIDLTVIKSSQKYIVKNDWKLIKDSNITDKNNIETIANMHGVIYQINLNNKCLNAKPIFTNFYDKNRIVKIKKLKNNRMLILDKLYNIYLFENDKIISSIKIHYNQERNFIVCESGEFFITETAIYRYSKGIKKIRNLNIRLELHDFKSLSCFSPNGKLFCNAKGYDELTIYSINDDYSFEIFDTIKIHYLATDYIILNNDCLLISVDGELYKKNLFQLSFSNFFDYVSYDNEIEHYPTDSQDHSNYETLLSNTSIYGCNFKNAIIEYMDELFIEKIKFNGGLI